MLLEIYSFLPLLLAKIQDECTGEGAGGSKFGDLLTSWVKVFTFMPFFLAGGIGVVQLSMICRYKNRQGYFWEIMLRLAWFMTWSRLPRVAVLLLLPSSRTVCRALPASDTAFLTFIACTAIAWNDHISGKRAKLAMTLPTMGVASTMLLNVGSAADATTGFALGVVGAVVCVRVGRLVPSVSGLRNSERVDLPGVPFGINVPNLDRLLPRIPTGRATNAIACFLQLASLAAIGDEFGRIEPDITYAVARCNPDLPGALVRPAPLGSPLTVRPQALPLTILMLVPSMLAVANLLVSLVFQFDSTAALATFTMYATTQANNVLLSFLDEQLWVDETRPFACMRTGHIRALDHGTANVMMYLSTLTVAWAIRRATNETPVAELDHRRIDNYGITKFEAVLLWTLVVPIAATPIVVYRFSLYHVASVTLPSAAIGLCLPIVWAFAIYVFAVKFKTTASVELCEFISN